MSSIDEQIYVSQVFIAFRGLHPAVNESNILGYSLLSMSPIYWAFILLVYWARGPVKLTGL